jgi:protein O-GlcNAc transferase
LSSIKRSAENMFNWLKSKIADRAAQTEQSSGEAGDPAARGRALRAQGNAWLDKGQIEAALASYEQAVAVDPQSADSRTSLGFAMSEMGRFDEAHRQLTEAVALDAASHDAYYLLGSANHALNRNEEAVAAWRGAITRKPDFDLCRSRLIQTLAQSGDLAAAQAVAVEGINASPLCADMPFLLGSIQMTRGKLDEAVDSFDKAIKIKPDFAQAHQALGEVLKRQGHRAAAIESHRRCVTLSPAEASARARLAAALHDDGQIQAAVSAYQQALALDEHHAESYVNMGLALHQLGRDDDSVASYRKALALQPELHDVHTSLGDTLASLSRLEEAVGAYRQALALRPDDQRATNNMAGTLLTQGKIDMGLELLSRTTAIDEGNVLASGNMLFGLNYHPERSAEEIFAAYVAFDWRFGVRWREGALPHSNDRNAKRRLRVGYVSPDFRRHAAQHFLLPLFDHHDKAEVEIYAYAELLVEDRLTADYKRRADHWIPIAGKTDEQVAALVREYRIDILVDLAGHTTNNRLGVFARTPAPVSVSWLGFGYTTGLSAIDYFLTDETAAPAGSDHLFAERVWRIPTPSYAYRPTSGMGEPGPLPAERRGFVTFGTLTRAIRMNHRVVRVWSQILSRVPGARLVIDSVNYQDAATRDALLASFASQGIGPERVDIGFHSPPWDTLRSIDIALDCFPHNSGTTLFESLYMGLPYVTLASRPSVGRLGSTILEGAGHPEWIAHSEQEYIDKAVALAADLPRLATIRTGLRAQTLASPLMDEPGFARKVETAYREMFTLWADKP